MKNIFPEAVWDGTSKDRPSRSQHSTPSPDEWTQMLFEVEALQKAIGVPVSSWLKPIKRNLRQIQDDVLSLKSQLQKTRHAIVPLSGLLANGTKAVAGWSPSRKLEIKSMSLFYHTKPSSAAGTIVLDVYKSPSTLIQKTASFDLEVITDKTRASIPMKAISFTPDDYLFVEIISDNADALAGSGGILKITY